MNEPITPDVFTAEDYWFLGKTMAMTYQSAIRRRAAAVKLGTCVGCRRVLQLDDIQPHGKCDDCEYEGRTVSEP